MREYNESFNENILTLTKNQDLLDFGGILHSGVEIVFLYGGETRVWVGNKSVETAKAGDAIIIFPNQIAKRLAQEHWRFHLDHILKRDVYILHCSIG